MSPLRVLVFPGGTEIGLEIGQALGHCKEVELFSAGLDVPNHAPFFFRKHEVLPSVFTDGWLDALNDLIEREAIDYVYPAYDDVLLALAENAEALKATVVTSPLETCRITRLKSRTYAAIGDLVPVPRVFASVDDVVEFPVFVKPDRGQGSSGAAVVGTAEELRLAVDSGSDLIMEFLPGTELTVDCFSDREHGLLYCRGRRRLRIRAGISMSATLEDDPMLEMYAKGIAERLALHGAWFFQVRKDAQSEYRVLEVAPRVAGTMALNRVLGVNFPLLSLYEQERVPVSIAPNPIDAEIDRALVNRYRSDLHYSTAYIDLDDTLVLRGEVDTSVIRFVYQCVNKGVRLVLLTRHREDLATTLRRHRLDGLWDDVVHVTDESIEKGSFIQETDAILIDDSYRERAAAREQLGILTFDSSMVELLLDDRV